MDGQMPPALTSWVAPVTGVLADCDGLSAEERWNKSKSMSKLCYLNKHPPGDKILSSKEYLPDENDLENIENGIENFSIIKIDIQSIDWLNLNYKGHERMIIDFLGNSKVNYRWVAP